MVLPHQQYQQYQQWGFVYDIVLPTFVTDLLWSIKIYIYIHIHIYIYTYTYIPISLSIYIYIFRKIQYTEDIPSFSWSNRRWPSCTSWVPEVPAALRACRACERCWRARWARRLGPSWCRSSTRPEKTMGKGRKTWENQVLEGFNGIIRGKPWENHRKMEVYHLVNMQKATENHHL